MSGDVSTLSIDVATYVGAVTAGVSVNGLTVAARGFVQKVRDKLHLTPVEATGLLTVTPELVAAVDTLLRDDLELRKEAELVLGRAAVDRSIIIRAEHVSDVTQNNY